MANHLLIHYPEYFLHRDTESMLLYIITRNEFSYMSLKVKLGELQALDITKAQDFYYTCTCDPLTKCIFSRCLSYLVLGMNHKGRIIV